MSTGQYSLFQKNSSISALCTPKELINELLSFSLNLNQSTVIQDISISNINTTKFINEYWTKKQRQSNSLHEISYRACFKPELPNFFISRLSCPGDLILDPFGGRGTTIIEANLLQRGGFSNDVNPLSKILAEPRLHPPCFSEISDRLNLIPLTKSKPADIDLSMFYHEDTERELVSLRNYFINRILCNSFDNVDAWLRMVATNRLTGHSSGFFSVYTLPPNQAASQANQVKINNKRNQKPVYRDVKDIILKKSKSLLRNVSSSLLANLITNSKNIKFTSNSADRLSDVNSNSIQLTVTSPPFLDIVNYRDDNWLRCWFNDVDTKAVDNKLSIFTSVEKWSSFMSEVFLELFRVTKPGGWVAFEVGEVRKGKIKLDEYIVPEGVKAGFNIVGVMVNQQDFTKTSNIWGVNNNSGGTNTNRIVIFYKE